VPAYAKIACLEDAFPFFTPVYFSVGMVGTRN